MPFAAARYAEKQTFNEAVEQFVSSLQSAVNFQWLKAGVSELVEGHARKPRFVSWQRRSISPTRQGHGNMLRLTLESERAESPFTVDEIPPNLTKSELNMATPLPTYSHLFSCLYDESEPIGRLGRGTHYSVFRTAEWFDVARAPLSEAQVHDFAVIWDEDHDTRVIQLIEHIYMAGLLSPVQFIGERKGNLTVIVAAKFYYDGKKEKLESYVEQLKEIALNPVHGDSWPVEVGMFDRSPGTPHQTEVGPLIADEEHKVITYLRNIDSLWSLGTRPYVPGQ